MNELLSPETVATHGKTLRKLEEALGSVLLGQSALIRTTLICLLSRGHLLLEGLPGLGKTELVKGLARLFDLDFSRVQFTPDLLPADITGAHVLEESESGRREFSFRRGPVFTNLLLADEINRASPKTQAALLEAMQERRVTLMGTSHPLPTPFFVLATQNPIELEGTYPLPEAQVDRFTFKVPVSGVSADVLTEIITTRLHGAPPAQEKVLDRQGLQQLFDAVDRVFLPKPVAHYIGRLVAATDPTNDSAPEAIRRYVRYGASPRAAIALASTSRAAALMNGKPNVGFEEVQQVLPFVLGHRLLLDYQAGLDAMSTDTLVKELLGSVAELSRMPKGSPA